MGRRGLPSPDPSSRLLKSDFHQDLVLIMGIDGYAHGIPALRTAVNDARLLFFFAGHGIALDGDDGPAGCGEPAGSVGTAS